MRLWSVHPKYLDSKGLVALWREALLAQKVLREGTKGYINHPQLLRFRNHRSPREAIADYLIEIWNEAKRRGYRFQKTKISKGTSSETIPISEGQLRYEFNWLLSKLRKRDPQRYKRLRSVNHIECHPLFRVADVAAEEWEKTKR